MRWLWPGALAIPLSGCALPPAVTIASLALDFASYGQSGKTVTDHGISLVLQKDCSLLRVLDGPICTEENDEDTAVAAVAPAEAPDSSFGTNDSMPLPRDLAYLEEEANRVMSPYAAQLTASQSPRQDFAGGPDGTAAETPRPGDAAALDVTGYLGDGARPTGARPAWRQVSDTGYLADGVTRRGRTALATQTRG